MKYKIKVCSIWEYGSRKDANGDPHQEDCTFPLPKDLKNTDRTFILCDGMGGHDAGEVASSTVCQAMSHYILNDGHDAEGVFTDDDLSGAIDAAFRALDEKDNGAEKKMGTTMTFLKFHNDGATIAHMGDSRVYHIRPGKDGENTKILFETEDHSLVNDLVKIGELTPEEALTSKQKNIITRAMQPNIDRRPKADIHHTADIRPGDFFYLCSDGMLEQEDMANGDSIKNIFSEAIPSIDDKVRILTEATKHNKDNHTALIIKIESVRQANLASEGKNANTTQYDMAEVEEDTHQTSASPKKKPSIVKLICRLAIVAILVGLCVLGIKYIGSSTDENDEQIELRQDSKKPNKQERKATKTKAEQPRQEQEHETQDGAAPEAPNNVTPQPAAPAEAPQRHPAANTPPSTVIQSLKQDGVVNSDNQNIRESLNK